MEVYFLPFNTGDCVPLVARRIVQVVVSSHFEWDVKAALKTTSSLAVTTSSVPIGPSLGLQWKKAFSFLHYS